MQVSDYLQEFLTVEDKLKLINFENKKLQELHDYLTLKDSPLDDLEEDTDTLTVVVDDSSSQSPSPMK